MMTVDIFMILRVILYIVLFIVALCALLLGGFIALIVKVRRKYCHIPGPPVTSFFKGNVNVFMDHDKYKINRQNALVDLCRKYGPMVRFVMYHKVVIMVSSPQMAKHLLTDSKYKKPQMSMDGIVAPLGIPFLGNSIVTICDHQEWKLRRHALNPSFHRSFLEQLIPVFNETAEKMVDLLSVKAATGQTVSMLEFFSESTLDAICRVAFSLDFRELDKKTGRSLTHDIVMATEATSEYNYNRRLAYDSSKREIVRQYREALRGTRQTMTQVLEERLECMTRGEPTPEDMLSSMLEGLLTQCSKEDIVSEMITILAAGFDTTSSALSFTMMELGRHPEYMERVRQEVSQVIGDRTTIEKGALSELHWMTAAVKEALRLYPPGIGTNREIPQSEQFFGHNLDKRDGFIFVCFPALHRLHFEDGDLFRPERWLPENDPRTDYNYMPFSLGQRSCIGRQFAWMEAKIILCKFFQRFHFHLDANETFDTEERLTQKPVSGAKGTLTFV